jgi:Phosphoserine phosphatase RsbU, N-terminal domain
VKRQWGDLGADYEAALERYVDVGEEVDLEAAHAFSREAFGDEMSVLDVVGLHRRVVEGILVRASSAEVGLVAASFTYLCEALSTFEMTQRGYWEAQHHAEREQRLSRSSWKLRWRSPA